jgi:hypothetical protein
VEASRNRARLNLARAERVVRAIGADFRCEAEAAGSRPGLAGLARWNTASTVTLDVDVVDAVVVAELEGVVAQVLDVLERAGVEVVEADHTPVALEQVLAEMGAEKAGAAGDDCSAHA